MSNIIHFRVKKEKSHVSKTTAEYKHSTVVSGTTPSGCTQRAPTNPVEDKVDQSTSKKKRDVFFKTVINCKQSTTVSGTTPSGCTQRAPTGLRNPVDQSTDRKIDIIKPKADCQQSTLALGTTPSGCTQRAPANTEFIRHTQWVTNINSGKEKFLVAYPTEQTVVD